LDSDEVLICGTVGILKRIVEEMQLDVDHFIDYKIIFSRKYLAIYNVGKAMFCRIVKPGLTL